MQKYYYIFSNKNSLQGRTTPGSSQLFPPVQLCLFPNQTAGYYLSSASRSAPHPDRSSVFHRQTEPDPVTPRGLTQKRQHTGTGQTWWLHWNLDRPTTKTYLSDQPRNQDFR